MAETEGETKDGENVGREDIDSENGEERANEMDGGRDSPI